MSYKEKVEMEFYLQVLHIITILIFSSYITYQNLKLALQELKLPISNFI